MKICIPKVMLFCCCTVMLITKSLFLLALVMLLQIQLWDLVLYSHIQFLFITQGEKYKDAPPDAVDMLKEMHNNKKKGIAPAVQSAIVSKLSVS